MKKIKFSFTSIRAKLQTFFLISCLVPFLILGCVSWYNYQKTINENVLLYKQQVMSLTADKLENFLNKLDQFYYAVYAKNLNQNLAKLEERSIEGVKSNLSLAETISQLWSYYGLVHTLSYVSILSLDGKIVYQNDLAMSSDYNFQDAPWFTSFTASKEQSCLTSPRRLPYHDTLFSQPSDSYMGYARKITGYNTTRQQYIFYMEFDSAQIHTMLSPLIEGKSGNLFLFSGSSPIYTLNGDQFSNEQIQALYTSCNTNGNSHTQNIDGYNYLVNRYPLEGLPFSILCTNSLSEIMEGVPDLKEFMMILIILSFFFTILLARFFSRKLVKPIEDLKAVTYEVMNGSLDVTIPPLPKDETGELGNCIDRMLQHIRQLILEKYQYSLREKEMQIHTLQSQINPHFLYNTLETISSIAENEGVEQVSDIALSLADLYRYTISPSESLVPVNDELNHIRNYLDIMHVRYGERIRPHFHIEKEAESCQIMKLTLQPLVENAIYHGLEEKCSQGNLIVSAFADNHSVRICVADDGIGMDAEQLASLHRKLSPQNKDLYNTSGHIGIVNVYQRLRLRFGNDCAMILESEKGVGTKVEVQVPRDFLHSRP